LIQRKMSNVSTSKILPYASCLLCRQSGRAEFKSAAEFIDHLRTMHCTKEGVADKDYEEHIRKVHLPDDGKEELAKLLQSMRFTENVSTSNQPSLVQDSIQPKNVYSLAQNLSAALNDPRKTRHLTSQFFTRHWGESFVETAEPPPLYNHRAVTWKNVESYMNEICPRHRRHLKDERKILKRFKKSQSVSGESEIATSTLNIPELFCSSSFCLKNVTCFNALIQLAEQSSQDGKASANLVGFPKEWTASLLTEQSLRSYKLFQEKLGHYLDSVEIDIAYHLSKKSSSFFQLMTSHDQLRKLLLNAITVANILRQQVHCIDEMLCSRWLRLIYLKQRRARCAMLAAKLDLVNAVSQTQATVQSLLASSDYLAALELIATTRAVLNEELKEFKEPMYNDDAVLEFDLYCLNSIVTGLIRLREFRFFATFKEETFSLIKNLVRQVAREEINVIHRLAPTDTEKNLAEEMRNFTFDVWLDVFTKIASAVLRFCKKLKIVLERICALIDYAIHKSTADDCSLNRATTATVQPANLLNDVCLSQYDADTLHDTVEEFLPQACTYAEERLCRVLSARGKEKYVKLSGEEFARLVHVINKHDDEFQNLLNRPVVALRAFLRSQVNLYMQSFHEDRKTKLTTIIDSEMWKRADVPSMFQDIVDRFSLTKKLQDVTPVQQERSSRSYLSLGGEKYVVVGTALILLQIVAQYCQLVDELPLLCTGNVLSFLIEILKAYNSRCCQLILGAGAVEVVGLKTIAAVHLALSCRSLQLIAYFIPHLHSFFESHLPETSQHQTRHFVQLLKDYEDHVNEIFNKMVSIVELCIVQLLDKWSLSGSLPSSAFLLIFKQIRRFHDSVNDILKPDDLKKVMLRIYGSIRKSVDADLQRRGVNAKTANDEYKFACDDFCLLVETMRTLPAFSDAGELLDAALFIAEKSKSKLLVQLLELAVTSFSHRQKLECEQVVSMISLFSINWQKCKKNISTVTSLSSSTTMHHKQTISISTAFIKKDSVMNVSESQKSKSKINKQQISAQSDDSSAEETMSEVVGTSSKLAQKTYLKVKKTTKHGNNSKQSSVGGSKAKSKPREKVKAVQNLQLTAEQRKQYFKPFQKGWKRELVLRTAKDKADAYYIAPDGKKFRSIPEVTEYALLNPPAMDDLQPENFIFRPILIGWKGNEEYQRSAKQKAK
ncbi:Vacuolar protein sorting-associated protein 54, partial [Trichinella sp. T9]